jgi:hypothetical protein
VGIPLKNDLVSETDSSSMLTLVDLHTTVLINNTIKFDRSFTRPNSPAGKD